MQVAVVGADRAFWAHIARVEKENETEKFASAPPGTFRKIYTAKALRKTLAEPGWCRVWVIQEDDLIVAHASLYDLGEPDGVCFGHISVEGPWRGLKLAARLQKSRLAYCDANGLTLVGAVAPGNDTSFHGCRKVGFQYLRQDPDTKEIWVFRSPQAPKRNDPVR